MSVAAGPLPRHRPLVKPLPVPLAASTARPSLDGCSTGSDNLAIDGPDEAGELAGDRRYGDVLELAFPDQGPIARAEPALCLPGDLANGSRRRRHFLLLLLSHPGGMLIAPRAFRQHAARPTVAGLGNGAALDRFTRRLLRRHQTEVGHQLAGRLKAR